MKTDEEILEQNPEMRPDVEGAETKPTEEEDTGEEAGHVRPRQGVEGA
jgi:hypothetical protein